MSLARRWAVLTRPESIGAGVEAATCPGDDGGSDAGAASRRRRGASSTLNIHCGNEQQPGSAYLVWPAERKLGLRDKFLMELFMDNVAGGAGYESLQAADRQQDA